MQKNENLKSAIDNSNSKKDIQVSILKYFEIF